MGHVLFYFIFFPDVCENSSLLSDVVLLCHVLPLTNKPETAAQIALSELPLKLSGQESH